MSENKTWNIEKPITGMRIEPQPWVYSYWGGPELLMVTITLPVLAFGKEREDPITVIPHWN
ncbi:MAG TPA: hypothetical protein P5110_07530 [Candidatus Omnitrophota bacterium]|nr:hypothetical protein [Candidatus Omnitrophota bacterium]